MTNDKQIELQNEREKVKSKINASQKERAKKIVFVSQKIDDIVNGFGNKEISHITFQDLELFKIGERIEVNNEVTFEKIFEDKNRMTFLTHMLDGGSFGVHSHDCYEITKVLKGNLIERNYGMNVYLEGQEVVYSPNEIHRPYATMDSTYEVTFCKKLY